MNRKPQSDAIVFIALVALGVAGRWLAAHGGWPNATPLAAIGLFAGFYFPRRLVALAAPLAAMVISNLFLDPYGSWLLVLTVYSSFLLAPTFGRALKNLPASRLAAVAKTAICVLAPSCFFYLTTNAAQWLVDGQHQHSMYSRSWNGVGLCFTAGIPFFRWMLSGDLAFTALIFTAYGLSVVLATTTLRSGKRLSAGVVKMRG